MVFQKPTPFPMSIYENIAFGIRLYEKLPKRELDERVESALRARRLWDEVKDKLDANGLGLSGGQQQRLCIARTVAVKPEVILFDEPCSALDPISTAKIEELIDELKDDYTIVIVTHNMQQAARVSDFTAFMYLGELIEFEPDAEIFTAPEGPAHAGLHHRPVRLASLQRQTISMTEDERHAAPHHRLIRCRAQGTRWAGRRDGRPRRELFARTVAKRTVRARRRARASA